jgi:protein involved in polysaccharide export with SLBB domain
MGLMTHCALVGGVAFHLLAPNARAQQVADTARATATTTAFHPDALGTGQFAARTQLQQAASGTGPGASAAEERLTNGDFQVGDRIALAVQGEPTLTDTFTVREGQTLRVPNVPDIALHGVLRSELQGYLTKQLAEYLRNPVVRATPLVRVAVLGQVTRPGYYSAPADELVSDMLMRAGGPTTNADVNKTEVHRGGLVIVRATAVQKAMSQGQTIDQLDLRPGDQLVVGERPQGGHTLQLLGIVAAIAGIGVSIAYIATR